MKIYYNCFNCGSEIYCEDSYWDSYSGGYPDFSNAYILNDNYYCEDWIQLF